MKTGGGRGVLKYLEIENIALIDRIIIEPDRGLNVFTGETGAGKSIIIDSIGAVLGGRVSREMIRTGQESAKVQAVFELDQNIFNHIAAEFELDPDDEGLLILSRELSLTGKNICRINGKIVPLSVLKCLGEKIVDIHGQFDNQSLMKTDVHIMLLDSFAGSALLKLKERFHKLLSEFKDAKTRLREIIGDKFERERKIDLLQFQINDIKKACLKPGEDEILTQKRLIIQNSYKLTENLTQALVNIDSSDTECYSAIDRLNTAYHKLQQISRIDEKYASIASRFEDLIYALRDIAEEIRNEIENIQFDPKELDAIDERLDEIFRLKKKYGNSIPDILSYCHNAEIQLDNILNSEIMASELQEKLNILNKELFDLCVKLNQERLKVAEKLDKLICDQLADLEMPSAKFKTAISFNSRHNVEGFFEFTEDGLDQVEFLVSANAGEPLKPLSKVASGGELSRLMLAIKTILADADNIPVLIFDEIDTGISGKAAQKVGQKLSLISRNHQVICVTHHAQIASLADCHFYISKNMEDNFTKTRVNKLKGDCQIKEIARILAGSDITSTTLKLAKEMISQAYHFKKINIK